MRDCLCTQSDDMVVPTEVLLRRELVQYGTIVDVVVKQYSATSVSDVQ